eukprot:TRINITY_DN9345_c0_g1_i4.p1 TRINITY_DN9345_c0_g1~~TRINITY_DN9345_c0_g1_i4.p1  ORF type:complete len:196 (+),score=22.05 TRINITY_DN9345_c0_g1_i4:345-932(+)
MAKSRMDYFCPQTLDMFHRECLDEGGVGGKIHGMWYAQFYHAYLIAMADGQTHLFEQNVRQELQTTSQQEWQKAQQHPLSKVSEVHTQIFEVLQSELDKNSFSVHCLVGSQLVDVYFPSQNLVVEIDDASRCSRNSPHKLMCPYVLKTRILESQGYQVKRIPFFEWNQLQSLYDRQQYLKDKLGLLLMRANQMQD